MLFCIEFFFFLRDFGQFLISCLHPLKSEFKKLMSNSVDLQDNLQCTISIVTEIWYYHTISLNDWSTRKQLVLFPKGPVFK